MNASHPVHPKKEIALPHRIPPCSNRLTTSLLGLLTLSLAGTLGLIGCNTSADSSDKTSNGGRALQRFDQFQGAADNGKVLVVVGANGVIVSSKDRGTTWTRQEVGSSRASLIGVAACADGSFGALDFFHRVWIADSDGENWRSHEIQKPGTPLSITCDSRNRLWVVGSDSTIASSADGGANWTETSFGEDAMLASIQFIDAERGFITGEFGSVYQTSDGGAHWHVLPKIGADFYPYAAHFADAEHGWVSGLAGVVMYTRDGGKSWQKEANPLGAPIYGLSAQNGQPVGVGINGLVFRWREGQWALDSARPTSYLRAALPLGDGRLLLAGGNGMVEVSLQQNTSH